MAASSSSAAAAAYEDEEARRTAAGLRALSIVEEDEDRDGGGKGGADAGKGKAAAQGTVAAASSAAAAAAASTEHGELYLQVRLDIVCLLTDPYQAPHLMHKMLVLKDFAVFRLPGVLYADSAVRLYASLRLGVAVSWEMTYF